MTRRPLWRAARMPELQTAMANRITHQLAIASYNIHQSIGRDRQCRPGRIAEVIRSMHVDFIALQEVDSRPGLHKESMQMDYLAHATDMEAVPGHTITRHTGHFGNVLLTRHPVLSVRQVDISVPGREPRGIIDAELDIHGLPLRVIATHLGLGAAERRFQVRRILQIIDERPSPWLVVLGDFNEWSPWGRPLRWLNERLGKAPNHCTFPARASCLALDRIWLQPRQALTDLHPHITPLARIASDHLPLWGLIDFAPGSQDQVAEQ